MGKKITVIKNGKEWTKDSVRELLLTNDKAVNRAVMLIYSFQTADEKIDKNTNTHNGQGYSKFHANIMSSFAQRLQNGQSLSIKQMETARKIIVKYTGQIFNYMRLQEAK